MSVLGYNINMSIDGFWKQKNTNVDKTKQNQIVDDPILYIDEREGDPDLYVIVCERDERYIKFITRMIHKVWGSDARICILYGYKIEPKNNDDSSIGKFTRKYRINLKKYIPEWSKILTFGRGLYCITREAELKPEAFYSYNTKQSTCIFTPELKSWVWPVDELYSVINLSRNCYTDTFAYFFWKKQLELSYNFKTRPLRIPVLTKIWVDNPNDFLKQYIGKDIKVAWDLETEGLLYYKCKVICVTLSFDGRTGYYLPWDKVDPLVFNEFLEGKYQIGANLKFDCKFMRSLGVSNAKIDFDTLNAGHVINEIRSNSLGSHGWVYTYYGGHEIPLEEYKDEHNIKLYSLIPKSILFEYAVMDAIITYQVYEKEYAYLLDNKKERGDLPNLYDYYFNEVIPTLNMYIDIEMTGMYIDWDRMNNLVFSYQKNISKVESEIYSLVGKKFNISSPEALGLALKNDCKLPEIKGQTTKNKKGEVYYKANEECLNTWERQGYKIASLLKRWRELDTMINMFIGDRENSQTKGYWRYKDDKGFIHPTYEVMLADSGRLKCSSPNIQQCLPRYECLYTNKGYFTFEELFKDYPLGNTLYKGELRVIDDKGDEDTIERVYRGYSDTLICFNLSDGSKFECTPDHHCFVIRNNEEIMIKASEVLSTDLFIRVD